MTDGQMGGGGGRKYRKPAARRVGLFKRNLDVVRTGWILSWAACVCGWVDGVGKEEEPFSERSKKKKGGERKKERREERRGGDEMEGRGGGVLISAKTMVQLCFC